MSVWSLSHATIENFKAINNVSLDISPGFSVITGPNGSGIIYTYAMPHQLSPLYIIMSTYSVLN
jgi:ABC-type uncharacterized transport system ATPase subunit